MRSAQAGTANNNSLRWLVHHFVGIICMCTERMPVRVRVSTEPALPCLSAHRSPPPVIPKRSDSMDLRVGVPPSIPYRYRPCCRPKPCLPESFCREQAYDRRHPPGKWSALDYEASNPRCPSKRPPEVLHFPAGTR